MDKQVSKYMLDLQFSLHTVHLNTPEKIKKEFDEKLCHEDLQKKELIYTL